MACDMEAEGINQTLLLEEFDRCNHKRNDKVWLNNSMKDIHARYILFFGLKVLVTPGTDVQMAKVCKLTYEEISTALGKEFLNSDKSLVIFLGSKSKQDPQNYFSCSFSYKEKGLADLVRSTAIDDSTDFLDMRINRVIINCSRFDYALVLQARPLIDWNIRYRYCATCGSETVSQDAGHKRSCCNKECTSNKGVHNTCFPRTDPTCIMMVISKDKQHCLLGRKKIFPPGVYSCLAGFIEPGETLEDAVRREVKEESNISVEDVTYKYSQPWPYPSCLMLGCYAVATSSDITVCEEELEDVKWFSKRDVASAVKDPGSIKNFYIPPSYTIASQLIQAWVNDRKEYSSL